MRVFLAGAAGAIGRPLVAQLLAAGHEVVGTTRDERRAAELRARGAEAVVLDAFDRDAVRTAVVAARPEVVVHQLTALPQNPNPRAMRDALDTTSRLRRETVPTFVDAAREAGAKRIVVQSISFITKPDGRPVHDESAPLFLDAPPQFRGAVESVRDMEASALGAEDLEGVVLRYGFYYGPGTWYDRAGAVGDLLRKRRYPIVGKGQGRASWVHVDDAAAATVLALDRGEPGIYNVSDDEPPTAAEWVPEAARAMGAKRPRRLPPWLVRRIAGPVVVYYNTELPGNANGRAREALRWRPRPWREGFREVFG